MKPDAEQRYSKYEIARMIGSRALQIAMGAPSQVKLDEKDLEQLRYNPVEIAKLEFANGVLPLEIKRPMPGELKKGAQKKAA